jgi:hypothetical protein
MNQSVLCCERDQITYDDFVAIIKGQPRRRPKRSFVQGPTTSVPALPTVDEAADLEEIGPPELPSRRSSMSEKGSEKWVDDDEDRRFSAGKGILHAGREAADVHDVIADNTMSPLVVNRAVYRAHREMRLAILEASKRFEEDRARRAHARFIALDLALEATKSSLTSSRGASLVMRRGSKPDWNVVRKDTHVKSNSSHQDLLDNASERGGRPGRTQRKKTVSDMTGLLSGPTLFDSHVSVSAE